MTKNNCTAPSSFVPVRRYFCTRMVTYHLYAPILGICSCNTLLRHVHVPIRALLIRSGSCPESKFKPAEQLFRAI